MSGNNLLFFVLGKLYIFIWGAGEKSYWTVIHADVGYTSR